MRLTRAASIKLDISPDLVLPTIAAYTESFNKVCKIAWDLRSYNGVQIHHASYRDARNTLPAELAVTARMKATEAVKATIKLTEPKYDKENKKFINKFELATCPQSKQQSIRYSRKSYRLFLESKEATLLTLNGRIRVKLNIHSNIEKYLTWIYKMADLVIRNNKVYLNVVFEKDIADIEPNGNAIGLVRGINNLAVTSTGKFYGGKKVKKIQRKRHIQRKRLQKAGTRSAKRHLKKLSGKERRFKADVNHCVAKSILATLKPGDTLVLEDLSNIQKNIKKFRKEQRWEVSNWTYFELELFLFYKAQAMGIHIEKVNPAYTSQTCSSCGYKHKSNRKGSFFECKKCGYKANADFNAANNIREKYLSAISDLDKAPVNEPSPKKERKNRKILSDVSVGQVALARIGEGPLKSNKRNLKKSDASLLT